MVLDVWYQQLSIIISSTTSTAKLLKFDLTSYVPQQLQIFARSLYNIIMLQNNQN